MESDLVKREKYWAYLQKRAARALLRMDLYTIGSPAYDRARATWRSVVLEMIELWARRYPDRPIPARWRGVRQDRKLKGRVR